MAAASESGGTTTARQRLIVPLADLRSGDLPRAGGKGANLGELLAAGLPVPDGFVITVDGYREFVAAAGLDNTLKQATADLDGTDALALDAAAGAIGRAFAAASVPPDLTTAIAAAYGTLGEDAPAVAVRSSATAEDLPGASFAGQQETVLDVRGPEAVLAAVRRCWRSLWAAPAISYRQRQAIAPDDVAMAVVVQRMIQPVAAGVLFTADPVTSDRSRMILEAVPGLGEGLVQGSRTPDRYVLDHATGLVREQIPADQGKGPVLRDEHLATLHDLARQAEAHFRQPQDLEWALDAAGNIWLVQARPITTLAPEAELPELPTPPRLVASVLFELCPEGITPIDVDVGVGIVMGAFIPIPERLRLPVPFIWHEGIPVIVDWRRQGLLRQMPLRLATLIRAASYVPDDWFSRELPRLQSDIERLGVDPATLSDEALYDQIVAVVAALYHASGQRWLGIMGAIVRALPALVWGRWIATRHHTPSLFTDLVAGIPTVTAVMNAELADLASEVRENESLNRIWAQTAPTAVLDRLATATDPEVRAFGDRVTAFLRRWGRREDRGLSIRMPPWEAQPERVITIIGALAAASPDATAEDVAAAQRRAAAARARLVQGLPAGLGRVVLRSADALRTFTHLREDSHFYLFALAFLGRRCLVELGRRWEQAGALKTVDDVFLLRLAEIEAASRGNADLRSILRKRRPVWAAVQRQWRTWQTAVVPTGEYLRGVGTSPGRVTGPVRIILEPAAFGQFRPGEVLVAPATGPAWTPLFRTAAAVVTETGGTMSHAAIVAREYGLPGVSAVRGVTRALRNGEVVTVDGNAGVVQRAPHPPAHGRAAPSPPPQPA